MAYPGSLDELTNGVPSDGTAAATALGDVTYQHDDHHRALGVAVEAVETELGTDPAGAYTDVKTRLDAIDRRIVRFVIDGGGSVITTGAKKAYVSLPFSGTVTKWRLLGDASGAIVCDLWKDTYANFPPTDADSMTGSVQPTVTASATKAEGTTFTGWDTTIDAGDIIEVNVDSVSTFTKVYLDLFVTVNT